MIDTEEDAEMPGLHRRERLRLVCEQAAYWYLRCYDEPAMCLKDRRQFDAWMRESPENVAEFLRATDTDNALRHQELVESVDCDDPNVIDLRFPIHSSQHGQHTAIADALDGERDEIMIKKTTPVSWNLAAMVAVMTLAIPLAFGFVILKAGQALQLDSHRSEPVLSKVDANGWLEFHGETIGEAAAEFNRRNVVQIQIEHPGIAERRLDGYYRFRVDSPDEFAKAVALLGGIALTEDRSGNVLRFHLTERPTK